MTTTDWRAFLARTAAVAGGTVAGSAALMRLANRAALADMRATGGGYDPLAGGGTTTLDYDPRRRRLVRSFVSLDGTTATAPAASAWTLAGG